MTCECIDTFNALLKPRNTQLGLTFTVGGRNGMGSYPSIVTEQIEKGRGKAKAISVIPTFCPFCGIAYRPKAEEPADGGHSEDDPASQPSQEIR